MLVLNDRTLSCANFTIQLKAQGLNFGSPVGLSDYVFSPQVWHNFLLTFDVLSLSLSPHSLCPPPPPPPPSLSLSRLRAYYVVAFALLSVYICVIRDILFLKPICAYILYPCVIKYPSINLSLRALSPPPLPSPPSLSQSLSLSLSLSGFSFFVADVCIGVLVRACVCVCVCVPV